MILDGRLLRINVAASAGLRRLCCRLLRARSEFPRKSDSEPASGERLGNSHPRSMSRKSAPPDNAACEGFFGRLKNELFYPRDWEATTIQQFVETVDSYLRGYNEKRIKISARSLSPFEYRVSLGLAT